MTWLQTLCGPPERSCRRNALQSRSKPLLVAGSRPRCQCAASSKRTNGSGNAGPTNRNHSDRGSRATPAPTSACQLSRARRGQRARAACSALRRETARLRCSLRAAAAADCCHPRRSPPDDRAEPTATANPDRRAAPNRSPVRGTKAPQMSSARPRSHPAIRTLRSMAFRIVRHDTARLAPHHASNRLRFRLTLSAPSGRTGLATHHRTVRAFGRQPQPGFRFAISTAGPSQAAARL